MAKYRVVVRDWYDQVYYVDAGDEDEAYELVICEGEDSGGVEKGPREFVETGDEWTIEKLDEAAFERGAIEVVGGG